MKLAFIGGGAMGEAMLKCLLARGIATFHDITVSDVDQMRRELLSKEYGVGTLADNSKAIDGAELIVLAVKPQDLTQVMEGIKGLLPQQTVLSIVTGASLPDLRRGLNHLYVIRAVPNMPAQIGEGITVWTAGVEVSQKQKVMAQSVLGALGEEIYVPDEKHLDMTTALSGSGPAYVFLFIEALIDAGVHIGIPRNLAKRLVIQTVRGSTQAVEQTGNHPAELKNRVTSPGGTTTESLLQLEKGSFRSLIIEAVIAAYEKAKHL